MEHSETPWKLSKTKNNGVFSMVLDAEEINNGNGEYGLVVCECYGEKEESKANAQFIVKAVNNHERLAKLAAHTLIILDNVLTVEGSLNQQQNLLYIETQQALAELEE